ncbi:hypothetical protein M501DRAFT_604523 [Patellaria atrata CBS 101060]|uniref:Zn(2)-C6 fungal-type domain-containing protein n=1 Tax=Patellaria atrata CBS 101060 TaxID=1346257 RepID=A0A9P4VN73_9PEZI|nr:hypothetical protein M501DRAFT_604523 [Patellaria atrata CBS 101060]
MLKEDPLERLSASECLEELANLREVIIPAQNFETDYGTPTEKMSSSCIMDALRAAGYGGGQETSVEEAETQIHLSALSIPKSDRRLGNYFDTAKEYERSRQDGGGQELATEEARTWSAFPTLSTLKSVRQPGEFLERLPQIWDPPGETTCRPEEDEGSRQEVGIGTGNGSDRKHPKRQRTEGSSVITSQLTHQTSGEVLLAAFSDRGSSVNTDTSSKITEWEGSSYLRPFRLSEVLERHSIQHHEDDQSAPSPKAADKNQPSGSFQKATVESTAHLQDVQKDLDLSTVPHGLIRDTGTLTDAGAQANRHYMQDTYNRSKEQFEEVKQRYTLVGMSSPPFAADKLQSNLPDEVGHGNGPTEQTQQPTEKRFLVVSTIYGAIHLLVEGSNLLVNATNIAKIFGYNRILSFKGRPRPILSLTRELDTRLQGSYYTVESALKFCDLLPAQSDAQATHAIGQVLKETLQRCIENHRSGQDKLLIKPLYRNKIRQRCGRCARLHIICNREIPCQNCTQASKDCVYGARQ